MPPPHSRAPHILFFLQPGTNSRSQFKDMARGFEKAGCRVSLWELDAMWQAYARDAGAPGAAAVKQRLMLEFTLVVRRFIESNRVDCSCGMWVNAILSLASTSHEGRPASLFDVIKSPHLCMWLDAPMWAHDGAVPAMLMQPGKEVLQSPNLRHFINNPGTARDMERVLGFRNVIAESYGIEEETFRPHDDETRQYDLVYACGPGDPAPTPLMLKELESDDPDAHAIRKDNAERLIPAMEKLAARWPATERAAARDLLGALLTSQVQERDTPMLSRLERIAQGPVLATLLADPQLYTDVTMRVRQVEAHERAFTFAWLSRRFNCFGFGAGELEGWGVRAAREKFVPYEAQARMYSRGKVGLNVMRWQDDVGLNVKPYEIAASGAALLAQHRTHLADKFRLGEEAAEFRTLKEAAERLRELLESPEKLRAMREAGRARTLREHTWTAVAGRLLPRMMG